MARSSVTAHLTLDGDTLPVASATVEEQLSRPTRVRLELAVNADITGAVGEPATLELADTTGGRRQWSLVVAEQRFKRIENGNLHFELELYAPFWSLRHTRGLRKFRNLSSRDIIDQVLDEAGLAHQWRIHREPPVRKYCVQYRESHFDFVSRLLEFEGIHYLSNDDGSLTLRDPSSPVDHVSGAAGYALLGRAGALEGESGITAFSKGARVTSGRVTVNDYNWKKPAVDLLKSASATGDRDLEQYVVAAGYRRPSDGQSLAQRWQEAHRADARYTRGESTVAAFTAGERFRYDGAAAGDYLLLSVRHHYRDLRYATDAPKEEARYENAFEAIPAAVPFRPRPDTPRPVVRGAHTAMVRGPESEEIHTDQYGRFRAQFHWDREAKGTDEDSRWLRKLQESGTGANLARVGWEVSIAYVHGDPDRPIGLARDINGTMVPSFGQPADKTVMTIKTPTYPAAAGGYNELRFDDRAGQMLVHVHAERYLINEVRHDKTERIGQDQTHRIDQRLDRKVSRHQSREVGRDRRTTVGGRRTTSVSGNRQDTVAGGEHITVGGNARISVEGQDTETVGGSRLSFVGGPRLPGVAEAAKNLTGVEGATGGHFGLGLGGSTGALGGLGSSLGGLGASLGSSSLGSSSLGGTSLGGALGGLGQSLGGAGDLGGTLSGLGESLGGAGASLGGAGGLSSLASVLRGNLGRNVETSFTRTIGAAKISTSADQITHEAGVWLGEAIGGAKITLAQKNITHTTGGPDVHIVGGADYRKCDEDLGVSAKESLVLVGGVTSMETPDAVELYGRTVVLHAGATLDLTAGEELAIRMTPETISFEGPMLLSADDEVQFSAGSLDDLTAEGES